MSNKNLKFSIAYFGDYPAEFSEDKYDLLFKSAKYADEHNFESLWIPERHFHSFGGFSPNPSIIAAALSRETKNIKIRGGSVVLPLHHPIRIAEEWSMIDNFSSGRVGIAFASGWHPNDFVLSNVPFSNRRDFTFSNIELVRQLWRGKNVSFLNGNGEETSISIFPKPLQKELPIWLAVLGSPESYAKAGAMGAGILTNLIGQNIDDLKKGIDIYHEALNKHGHPISEARVVVLLHTFLCEQKDEAIDIARNPLHKYLSSSLQLFQKTHMGQSNSSSLDNLSAEEKEYLFERAYKRYVEKNALIGSVESCVPIIQNLKGVGVTEIAAFIDFGISKDDVLKSLSYLKELKNYFHTFKETNQFDMENSSTCYLDKQKNDFPINIDTAEDQYALWLLAKMRKEGSLAYHLRTTLRLSGELDKLILQKSIDKLIERHEALRTTFSLDGKHQIIHQHLKVRLHTFDFSNLTPNKKESAQKNWFEEEGNILFNFEKGPLWRVSTIKLANKEHLLVISIHHIICDGISKGLILEELAELYTSMLNEGQEPKLRKVVQYRDFLQDRNERLTNTNIQNHVLYWKEKFRDDLPTLNLPVENTYPAFRNYKGKRTKYEIDGEVWKKIIRKSAQLKCTPFMFMLSIWSLFLHKITDQKDLIVGVPVDNRHSVNGLSMVGYGFNLLPIRTQYEESSTFYSFLSSVKNSLLDAFEHYEYPFVRLLELFDSHDWTRSPMVASNFNMDKLPIPIFRDLKVSYNPQPAHYVRFDIGFNINETKDNVLFYWEYNSDLFLDETLENFHKYFMNIIDVCLEDSDRKFIDISLLASQDMSGQGLPEYINNLLPVHKSFEKLLIEQPTKIAAVDKERKFTYQELNNLSNAIAHEILKLSSGNEVIGIYTDNSIYTIASILGVFKSGNAFLGITDELPLERKKYMCSQANISIILTQKKHASIEDELKLNTIIVDNLKDIKKPLKCISENSDIKKLAYIVYTSGSTGQPKGVQITHQQLSHYITTMGERLLFKQGKNYLYLSPLNVDLGYTMLFSPFFFGGTLHLLDKEDSKNSKNFTEYLNKEPIDYLKITPSHFSALTYHAKNIKDFCPKAALIFGGEPLPVEIAKMAKKYCRVINHYGPAETTVGVFSYEFTEEDFISRDTLPIGKPFSGVKYKVVDQWGKVLPEGIKGELLIGGPTVTPGYIGDLPENNTKFITDAQERFYKTGDLVTVLKDSNVQFISRADEQIKIRGYRVELGEISSILTSLERVKEAVVIQRDENSLEAFVVTQGQSVDKIKEYLRVKLPSYMIPNKIHIVDKLPLLANGKVDKKTLESYNLEEPQVKKVKTINKEHEKMIEIWENVLGETGISIEDDFFDLGGTSIHAIKLCARLAKDFNSAITIADLFEYPTPRELLEFIDKELQVKKVKAINKEQEKMIEVWENVLDEANISLEDDFFDLGGTSIHAIKLCARLAKDFNSAITIADLFEYPTPRELLEFIDKENFKIAS